MFGLHFAALGQDEIQEGIVPKRQVVGTGGSTTSTTTADSSSPTSAASTTSSTEGRTTDPTSPTTAPSSSTAPSSAAPTTASSTSQVSITSTSTEESRSSSATSSSSSNLVVVGSSTIDRSTLSSATVVSSALLTSSTQRVAFTTQLTSNGQLITSVGTSDHVVSSTTGFTQATVEPALASGGSSSSNGLPDSTKKIIGGVVGGVGGALFIGAIAIFLWRLWAKKKREQGFAHNDYRDSANDSIMRQKDPLDRYRSPTPSSALNAASNF